jgi:hypothetical protein
MLLLLDLRGLMRLCDTYLKYEIAIVYIHSYAGAPVSMAVVESCIRSTLVDTPEHLWTLEMLQLNLRADVCDDHRRVDYEELFLSEMGVSL